MLIPACLESYTTDPSDDTTKTGLVLESQMSALRANATFKCIHFMAKKWICTNLLLTNVLHIYKY